MLYAVKGIAVPDGQPGLSAHKYEAHLIDANGWRAQLVARTLSAAGWRCQHFDSAARWMSCQDRQYEDVLVVVGDGDGDTRALETLRQIRTAPETQMLPVIMLGWSDSEREVAVIEEGADLYERWPGHPEIMLARANALMRRVGVASSSRGPREVFGEYVLEHGSCMAQVADRSVRLTPRDFNVALLMFRHAPETVDIAKISDQGWRVMVSRRVVAAQMSRLRQKLDLYGTWCYELNFVSQQGYALRPT